MIDINSDVIKSLDSESRYEVFLSLVAEERDIWILVNDDNEFLKIHFEDQDLEYLPIWPNAEFAEDYCASANEKLTTKSITVPEFFTKWVPGLEGDRLLVGAFPVAGSDVWLTEPSELKSDLQDTFSNQGF